jgi:hypothetical protein
MKSDNFNRWLTLVANFGILIGLALVAFEIRQNSDLVRLQFINDDLLAIAESETSMLGDNPSAAMMKSIFNADEMTYADFRVVDAYLTGKMELLVRRYQLGQEGSLDEDAWKTHGFAYSWFFGNEFAQAWWKHEGRKVYSDMPELVEHVDQMISTLEVTDSTASWTLIQEELAAE